jgi:putative hydroxymethylpyrimidine transport system substrate-binding protein
MNHPIFKPIRLLQVAALAGLALAAIACQSGSSPDTATQPSASQNSSVQQPTNSATQPSASKSPIKVSVALDWYPWSNHTGLYMAKEMGYYQEEGLEVDIYVPSNPEDVLKLVGSGKDTFGISYQSDVLLAASEGIPVKSIAALVQHPLNSVMTLKEAGLTRPKQLEGKKVGYPGIPGHEALLATMMENDGSSIDKVELVNVGFDLVPPLLAKKVDASLGAYWVHESILAELEGYPVDIMRVEQWGVPDFYELLLVTDEKTAKEQPEMVKSFLRAVAKGYAEVMKDPAKAIDLLVRVNPETNRQMEEKGIQLLMPLWTNGAPTFGWQTGERWQSYADWMREMKQLTKDVDVDSAFTVEFLNK